MKKSLILASTLAALMFAGLATPARAQGVAVIDLNYIFKNNPRFKSMTDEMRNSAKMADEEIRAKQETIRNMAKRLQELKPDSPSYRQLEQEIAAQQADLQAQVALRKREFERRETKIYYTVYQEVLEETQYFCRQNNISIVLKFNSEAVDEHKADSIVKQLNQGVVFADTRYDITEQIHKALLNRTRVSDQRTGVPVPGRPRGRQ